MATTLSTDLLRERLCDFDGKAVSFLSELSAQDGDPDTLSERLTGLLSDANEMVQRGASWMLHDRSRTGDDLTDIEWQTVSAALSRVSDWQARLHILQMLSVQAPPASQTDALAAFVTSCLDHQRPFLRAWAISALVQLAHHKPALADAAKAAVERGLRDPTASVRARACQHVPGSEGAA